MTAFCPATMCPLFAATGSPWTGEKNALCEGAACDWWDKQEKRCMGSDAAGDQAAMASDGLNVLQLAPALGLSKAPVASPVKGSTFDCPRAPECQWQIESGEKLCPPRSALARGLDPRVCAW